jgi:hypothetical protein
MRNNTSVARQLKEQILVLRKDNLSYNKIAQKLKCSKGTINYHLTEGAAEKIKSREGRREWRKIWRYVYEKGKPKKPFVYKQTLLRKTGRAFLYGPTRSKIRRNRMGLKHKNTKLLDCLKLIWPALTKDGMTKENDAKQAVNQWTGELDYYDDGKPIMTPMVRCKLSDKVVDVKGNDIHTDHINGDRTDNGPKNFSLVQRDFNHMKSDAKSYKILFENVNTLRNTLLKYRDVWDV